MHAAPARVAGTCRLLASDFRNRRVDAFDGRFDKLVRPAGAFVNPTCAAVPGDESHGLDGRIDPQSALRLEAWTAALRSGEHV